MKGLGKILSLIVWIVILLVAFLLLFSAFSPSIVQPVKHSVLSLAGFVFPLLVVINLLLLLLLLLFRRFKVALVPLAGLAMCYSQLSTYFPLNLTSTKQSEGSIKLLSYNTMSSTLIGQVKRLTARSHCLIWLYILSCPFSKQSV